MYDWIRISKRHNSELDWAKEISKKVHFVSERESALRCHQTQESHVYYKFAALLNI